MKKQRIKAKVADLVLNEGQLEWLPKREYISAVLYTPENDEDKDTIKRRSILDNGAFGSWDYDMLANEWDDLPLSDWGLPAWETDEINVEELSDEFSLPSGDSKDMAERKRNAKGQFVKGNKEGHHFPKGEAQRETARLGGIARQAQAKRDKMLKEELRAILSEETTAGSGVTKMQAVIQNVLKNTLSKGKALDLKILAEILGEMEINVNLTQSEKPVIMFDDGDDNV